MLPLSPQESPKDRLAEDGTNCSWAGSTDWDSKERKTAGQSQIPPKEVHLTPQKKKSVSDLTPQAVNMENITLAQRKEKAGEKQEGTDKKLGKKTKKNTRSAKALKKKEKDLNKPHLQQKVDFPEPLVKAHQSAYAFLNPSINKYDSLMELLEQATETQVLVQPMVAFMVLRYKEIIQGLEEMASEGEKVLKEYGEHLAWPSQMKNLSSSALKSGPVNVEPPPDLLQQLLQYTTQRMRNVSHSVGKLGDSALEETVEYFASVSELLEEKLKVKCAAETRLMQLLYRIEMASLRKSGPEDSALFSEDSGIGAESESLAGSDKQHRPESCGSTGTNRTFVSPMGYNSFNFRRKASRQMFTSQISPSVSLTSLNSVASTCTILANEQIDSLQGSVSCEEYDEVDVEMKDKKMIFRPRSISVDSEHPQRIPPKRIENPQNIDMTLKMKNAISGRIQFAKSKISDSPKSSRRQWSDDKEQMQKRPQTAAPKAVVKKTAVAKERRSQSAESLRSKGEDATLLELERTQKDLNQRLQKMAKNKAVVHVAKNTQGTQNTRTPAIQSPKLNRKNISMEKNFQATSNKVSLVKCRNKKQEAMNHLEEDNKANDNSNNETMKVTTPPTPPSSPRPSSGLSRGRNSVKKLIDTFSQGIEEREGPEVLGPLRGVKKCGVPVMPGLGNVEAVLSSGITSCRTESELEKTDYLDLDSLPPPPLEVLMDNSFESARSLSAGVADDGATKVNKSPLPKRAMVSQRLRASVHPVTVLPSKGGLIQTFKSNSSARAANQETSAPSKVNQLDPPEKVNDSLCKQARRIINLRNSHSEKPSSCVAKDPSVSQEKLTEDNTNTTVPGPNTTMFAVPSSTIRGQPLATTPASRTRVLPSTPTTPSNLQRRLPSPNNLKRQPTPPFSGSPVNSTPTAPSLQRRLPSPPVAKQNISNANSYPFKAPSPPASPKVQRWSRENSKEDLCSARKINNARSVFYPASSSLFEAPPCPIPQPPEAWTSTRVSFLSRMWGGHGHLPVTVQGPRSFIRRSQSDRRPSLNLPPRSPGVSIAETCGSEPMIYSQG